jgi:hypothetical protein
MKQYATLVVVLLLMAPIAIAQTDSILLESDFEDAINDDSDINELMALVLGDDAEMAEPSATTETQERPRGLELALLRLRYAFSMNPERKTELGLELAQARLLEAKEKMEERDVSNGLRALGQYQNTMEQVNAHLSRVRDERIDTQKLMEIQKRIELQRALSERVRDEAENAAMTAEQNEEMHQRMQASQMAATAARNAALERRASLQGGMDEETLLQAEMDASQRVFGDKQSAEVMMKSAVYAFERITNAYQRMEALEGNAEMMDRAKEEYDAIKDSIMNAREAYSHGEYVQAREHSQEARLRSARLYSYMMSQLQGADANSLREAAIQMMNATLHQRAGENITEALNDRALEMEQRIRAQEEIIRGVEERPVVEETE